MSRLFIIIILGFIFSCKVRNPAQQTQNDKNNEQKKDIIYRFNVSFISVGAGIDNISKRDFLRFIKEFEGERNIKIEMETAKWGREGEIDYCLKLSQLSQDEQAKFISEVKELLKNSKLVHFSENNICKNKSK